MVVVAAFAAEYCWRRRREDYVDPSLDQVGRQCGQPINFILGPAGDDSHVLALDIACPSETLAKSAQTVHHSIRGPGVEDADHRHRRLLRARRERPRRRRAAE